MAGISRSERLKKLLHLAEAKEKSSLRVLGQVSRELLAAELRGQELIDYRDSEQGRRLSATRPSPAFMDAREFFRKLTSAISQQQAVIADLRSRRDVARAGWASARHRVSQFERLIGRAATDQRRHEQLIEQKDFDELTQQRFEIRR